MQCFNQNKPYKKILYKSRNLFINNVFPFGPCDKHLSASSQSLWVPLRLALFSVPPGCSKFVSQERKAKENPKKQRILHNSHSAIRKLRWQSAFNVRGKNFYWVLSKEAAP